MRHLDRWMWPFPFRSVPFRALRVSGTTKAELEEDVVKPPCKTLNHIYFNSYAIVCETHNL